MFEVTIEGNVTRDPQIRFSEAGKPWATFGVAVNFRSKQPNGEWADTGTMFCDVACFGFKAEGAAEHLRKGDKVLVTGRFTKESYVGHDGSDRDSFKIAATSVAKVPKAQQTGGNQYRSGPGVSDDPWGPTDEAPF